MCSRKVPHTNRTWEGDFWSNLKRVIFNNMANTVTKELTNSNWAVTKKACHISRTSGNLNLGIFPSMKVAMFQLNGGVPKTLSFQSEISHEGHDTHIGMSGYSIAKGKQKKTWNLDSITTSKHSDIKISEIIRGNWFQTNCSKPKQYMSWKKHPSTPTEPGVQ